MLLQIAALACVVASPADSSRPIADDAPTSVAAPDPDPNPAPAVNPAPEQPAPPPVAAEASSQGETSLGFSPWNGLRVESADGRHSAEFGFLGQVRGTVVEGAGDDVQGGIAANLIRPDFAFHLWERRLTARLITEFAGPGADVLDAWVSVRLTDAMRVEIGQFRPYLSRAFRTALFDVGLTDRGVIANRMRIDRDVGLTLAGEPWGGKLEYYVGVLNGAGRNSTSLAPSPLLTARVVVAPLGPVPYTQAPYVSDVGPRSPQRSAPPDDALRVAVGGSAYTVANRETLELSTGTTVRTDPRRRWGASGDAVVYKGRVFSMAEGFYERRQGFESLDIDTQQAWAVYGQVGVLAWNPYLDVTMRSGVMMNFDREVVPIEPGLNVYLFGHHAKMQMSYRCDVELNTDETGCGAHTGALQAQLWF